MEKEHQALTFNPFMLEQEDVNLMKELNFDAYRLSISWSRIFPGVYIEFDCSCKMHIHISHIFMTEHKLLPQLTPLLIVQMVKEKLTKKV